MMSDSRSVADDTNRKDFKYLILEKENYPSKRDTEVLLMGKDSGKNFSSTTAGECAPYLSL